MRTCAGQWCACVRQLTSLSARALGGWRVLRRGAAAEVCCARAANTCRALADSSRMHVRLQRLTSTGRRAQHGFGRPGIRPRAAFGLFAAPPCNGRQHLASWEVLYRC